MCWLSYKGVEMIGANGKWVSCMARGIEDLRALHVR